MERGKTGGIGWQGDGYWEGRGLVSFRSGERIGW